MLRNAGRVRGGFVAGCMLLVALAPMPSNAAEDEWMFAEVSDAWNLAIRHHHGGSGRYYMVETVVGGVALFDYDGDGDLDVFLADGNALPGYTATTPGSRLLRNDLGTKPTFVDVTDRAGLRWDGYASGVTAGDYDGDGNIDLYVTALGANRLWRNRGDGSFEDATARAGVGDRLWSTGAAFADLDADGDLDLYVVNYVDFNLENHKYCGDPERDLQTYCHPDRYRGVSDRLYLNRGDGTFSDATEAAGLAASDHAGLGVVVTDFDGDHRPDIYVANDAEPNFLFRNLGLGQDGQLRFEDTSLLSGTAYDEKGRAEGGMGVAVGDTDGDGRRDIVVTNFELETNALYRSIGSGLFMDARFTAKVAESSFFMVAFGVALADFDHDADLDLVVANGHILDNAETFAEHSRYAQPNQLFRNQGGGRFSLVDADNVGFDIVRSSRGLATGDLDLDGDLDIVVVNANDRAEVWENRTSPTGDWLQVDLVQPPGRDRQAVGASLLLEAGGVQQERQLVTGASYLSQHAITAHFGVLKATDAASPPRLNVRWPDGRRTQLEGVDPGVRVRVRR